MNLIISFVLKQLNIKDLSALCNKWQECLDMFFYFSKINGCQVPSFEEVRKHVKVRKKYGYC